MSFGVQIDVFVSESGCLGRIASVVASENDKFTACGLATIKKEVEMYVTHSIGDRKSD